MAKKYAVEFKARRIGNGFILTGHIEANGGHKKIDETFYPDMPSLDVGLTAILSTAEQVAESIKGSTSAYPSLIHWSSIFRGDSFDGEEDDEDEGDDD